MQSHGNLCKILRTCRVPCSRDKRIAWLRQYSIESCSLGTAKINDAANSFYNYTSGRWLYNEHLRLPERRLYFDINELCLVIARSVGLPRTDVSLVTKIAEGSSYRAFEATFHSGLKVIARLPYPCTIPRRYGVASEVATIEFLRIHGIPIPKVLDWSSSASNQVGSEYIIMERAPGRELADTWHTMTFKERMSIVGKIVDVERLLFDIQFPASGSLFFKDSLDPGIERIDMPEVNSTKDCSIFCIGPSTEYLWWYQKRGELAANRGPCEHPVFKVIRWLTERILGLTTEEVLKAVGKREILWLQRFGKLRYPREPLYREFYGRQEVDPQVQINHLTDYLKVAPYLVPKAEQLNVPTIRHPGLSPSNILVSDSGNITGLIDWQHTNILPIFLQAKIPKHFQNYGDDDSEDFRRPELAKDFATLTTSDQEAAIELYRRRQVHCFYLGHTSKLNKAHFHAMGKRNLILRNQLYDIAGRPWEGDNTSLQAQLIKTMTQWSEIASPEDDPPVHYSPTQVEECLDRDSKQKTVDEQMQEVRDIIGINMDGLVLNEEFELARERAKVLKDELIQSADTEDERREIEE